MILQKAMPRLATACLGALMEQKYYIPHNFTERLNGVTALATCTSCVNAIETPLFRFATPEISLRFNMLLRIADVVFSFGVVVVNEVLPALRSLVGLSLTSFGY
eukprot:TRINITY_DN1920_c0_g1_i6.p1 TRINITY_DN1920_c0_g1~~TRINITY_DN1920_c0_g1_i6.p1  ORF type:complete len:104 (-),score=7.16 TRINITY_DN1920_c0_g1_i6:180-491(-)